MSQPTIPQLRALVALADTLHFGEAAAELGVSQPSVSSAISGLEAGLDAFLVERSTRRVLLTPVGERVAAEARAVLSSVGRLVEVARQGGQPFSGPLRLGLIPTVAPYVVAPVLRTLARRYPRLQPDITEAHTARLLDDLAAGRLDAVVVALPSGGANTREIPLYEEEFVLLVPEDDPLAGRRDVDPAVLRGLRLLLLDEGHCLRDQTLDICRQVGAATTHPARAASLTTVAQLVAAGLGVTLLPASAIAVETRKGRLATAAFRAPVPGRKVGLVHRAEDPRAADYAGIAAELRAGLARTSLPLRIWAAGTDDEADGSPPDGSPPDAGPAEASPPDARPPDARPDGSPDARRPDAGPPEARPPDAGSPDAGSPDAGSPDAGRLVAFTAAGGAPRAGDRG